MVLWVLLGSPQNLRRYFVVVELHSSRTFAFVGGFFWRILLYFLLGVCHCQIKVRHSPKKSHKVQFFSNWKFPGVKHDIFFLIQPGILVTINHFFGFLLARSVFASAFSLGKTCQSKKV